jgi:hypothetical protein
MNEFIQAILCTVTVLGLLGILCGFIQWQMRVMEKRLEIKFDAISEDVHRIADELREERRSKDALYKFVLDNYNKK